MENGWFPYFANANFKMKKKSQKLHWPFLMPQTQHRSFVAVCTDVLKFATLEHKDFFFFTILDKTEY